MAGQEEAVGLQRITARRRVRNPDVGLVAWLAKTSVANHWRVPPHIEIDDLIQDGLLLYCVCRRRYAGKVQSNAHMMSLVKTCFLRHLCDLSRKKARGTEVAASQLQLDGESVWESLLGAEPESASLQTLLGELPAHLKQLLLRGVTDGAFFHQLSEFLLEA